MNLERSNSKLVHILTPPNQQNESEIIYKVGRGNDQDLKLNDISVSRSHAKIVFDKGKFLL
jgi:pSer/pThr/pTyr-binding forkhead associated (FHA) protein